MYKEGYVYRKGLRWRGGVVGGLRESEIFGGSIIYVYGEGIDL